MTKWVNYGEKKGECTDTIDSLCVNKPQTVNENELNRYRVIFLVTNPSLDNTQQPHALRIY